MFKQVIKAFSLVVFSTICLSVQGQTQEVDATHVVTPEEYRKAVETFYKLDQSNNYTESLSYADLNVLPLGLKQTISNVEITIAISDMRLETHHSELTTFGRLRYGDHTLFFGAQGIKLSHTGDIIGDASLVLLGDYAIPIQGNHAALVLKGSFNPNTGRGQEQTAMSIDCQGFKEMSLAAEIQFSEELLVPLDLSGKPTPGVVKAGFHTVVRDLNDILVDIAIPPFAIKDLEDFSFATSHAVFDFSDQRNSSQIVYPQDYQQNYMIPGHEALWRGVYIRDLIVTLPAPFTQKEGKRVFFGAHDMIIDNNGITGLFEASTILPLDQGSASGWRFSVDHFKMALEANHLIQAGFGGMLGLPVGENATLAYDATITADNEYYLTVKPTDTLDFDLFNARAKILPNSYVQMKVIDGQFRPEALLHGSLNMAPTLGSTDKPIADFKGIEFRSLRLKTDAPRFTAEYFGYSGELKLLNFPVSVRRIGLRSQEEAVALYLDMGLTLSDNLFSGNTTLEIVGKLEEETLPNQEGGAIPATQRWRYDHVHLEDIAINAQVAELFTIQGQLTLLNNDPTYGDGFAGSVNLKFDKVLKNAEVTVRAMFGKTDFRYWFVDGKAKFPGPGLQVFTPLNLSGFGGGVTYRMKRAGEQQAATSTTSVKYIPDASYGMGIKAAVLFNVASDKALNGEASFEIAFNPHGGINFIGFYGFAKFTAKIPGTDKIENFVNNKFNKIVQREAAIIGDHPQMGKVLEQLKQYDPSEAAKKVFEPSETPGQTGFSAALGIQYDFTQNSLHATFDLYINAAQGLIRGVSSGNRAGWAVLHIDPSEWYVHMGTPTDRLGVRLGVGSLSVETGAYLMLGSRIPGSPPPPKQVADILGVDLEELDYMRDLNALGDGKGFAFGANLAVETGDITFLVLYANFQAGFGFDIMLKDYGEAQCVGRSGPIGMDGWYANGQAYVYLQGELGVKVNLWFIKTKFPIIKGAAAALVQAMLPNPTYFRGYLAIQFDILNGLITGSCNFKFEVGDPCELVVPGGSPLNMLMITDISPADHTTEVSVFTAPQATLLMEAGKPFQIETEAGVKTYRIQVNEFSISDNGRSLAGKQRWASTRNAVSYYSHEVLPSNKKLKATIKVGFEEYKNGTWSTVYTGGKLAQEVKEIAFTTRTAPRNIPLNNIQYSYPVVAQQYYLKDEHPKGYIQLQQGQSYLFAKNHTHEVHILNTDGSYQAAAITYDSIAKYLEYTMPPLQASQSYYINLVTLNKDGTSEDDIVLERQELGNEDNQITIHTAQANEVLRDDIGINLLLYPFSTSRYTSFGQKMNSLVKGEALVGRLSSDVINLHYNLIEAEPFDLADLTGTLHSPNPLIHVKATLSDAYYKEDIYPLVYQHYPIANLTLKRDTTLLGVPPVRAIEISTRYLDEIERGNYNGLATSRLPFIYNLPQAYKADFGDLQYQAVNQYLNAPQQRQYSHLINGYYPFIREGTYPVKLQYILPGGQKGTSGTFEFYNFIK